MTPTPDVMPDARAFLRAHPLLADLTAGRVFFRIPPHPKAPFIRLWRSGGGEATQNGDTPVFAPRLNIDVWGLAMTDWEDVRLTAKAIDDIAFTLPTGNVIGPNGTRLLSMTVTQSNDSPDPDTGWPRIVMSTIWYVSL